MTLQYQNHPCPILESRLDWITATIKPGERQNVVKGRIAAWISAQEASGYKRSRFVTPFYEGIRTEGIAWGVRIDDAMVTLSGKMAAERGALLVTWADTISRLDAQVTIQDGRLENDWATYCDQLAGQCPTVRSGETQTRLINSRPEGVTSYIGSPSSDRMLRCYDKWAESDHQYPPGAWRFEVQWRHKRADRAAQNLFAASMSPASVLAAVCNAYSQYGIAVPAACILPQWRDANITTRTDNERRLVWLRRSIAPAVGRLIDGVGLEVVLQALDLSCLADTIEGLQGQLATAEEAIKAMVWDNERPLQSVQEVH